MRPESQALGNSSSKTSRNFPFNGSGFIIDEAGYQKYVGAEKPATSQTVKVDSQPNWFGSKESIGIFTGRLFEGMKPIPRASHGLETRTIKEIYPESQENIVKLGLPAPLLRKEVLSQAS